MKIVKLNPQDELPTEPVEDVINELQSLLELAQSGVIRAFSYAIVKGDNDIFATAWTGASGTKNMLCAATNVLAHRVTGAVADSGKAV